MVLLGARDLPAAHYTLFVLTGQSNSLGTTNAGEADPTSGSDPADAHVLFAWHNIAGEGITIGHSGQTLSPASATRVDARRRDTVAS